MPKYEVTLEGFSAYHETWDHVFEVDGKRDEVYIHSDVRLIDNTAKELFRSQMRTTVMGDTNGYSYRIQADLPVTKAG